MENLLISKDWFPDYPNTARPDLLLDQRFDDFDAQAERLTGHDQQYFQTSAGAFHGRFVSVFLGPDVSVHIERANRALEQRLACPPGIVLIGLVLSTGAAFGVNGLRFDRDSVLVTTQGAEMAMSSPPGGIVLALSVATERLDGSQHRGRAWRAVCPGASRHRGAASAAAGRPPARRSVHRAG